MTRKILVPLDGTPLSEKVLPHAQALAEEENAELVLLRVPVVPAKELFNREPAMGANIIHDIELDTERYLEAELRTMEKGHVKVTTLMREGPVAQTIAEVAEEIQADKIAMSTHGYSGLQRLVKGSVAEEVVHLTHIPVILIHPN